MKLRLASIVFMTLALACQKKPAQSPDQIEPKIKAKAELYKSLHKGWAHQGGCDSLGFTVLRAVFVPYQMADGIWRLKFNLQGDFTSASVQTITVSVNGILMSASYTQSISAIYGGNSTGLKSYALINSNQLQTTTTASITANGVCLSGDVELSAKPTWAY